MLPDRTVNALTNGPSQITSTPHAIVADGPDGVSLFRLVTIKHALDLEIKTGMKLSRGSILKIANDAMGTNFRTKKAAYAAICELLPNIDED